MNKLIIGGLLLVLAAPAAAQHGAHGYGDQLGTVYPPATCNDAAQPHLERGFALLHHMTYEGAEEAFAAAVAADAACALGYWGQTMTYIHPLWSDPPSEERFEKGRMLLAEAKGLPGLTEAEQAYLDAISAYFDAGRNDNEKANLEAFADAWLRVHMQYPDDVEAAAFHALTHLATADPGDKSFTKQQEAGAVAEEVLAHEPDHPGGHHYVIHAYDVPPLADRGLDVARRYGQIAPAVPHALHMPTHIFTRLGLWDEAITMNQRSAEAALAHPAGHALSLHYLHALDYVAYAHLQRGQDKQARAVLKQIEKIGADPIQAHGASAYTLAAVPARLALERQDWEAAAALELQPASYPWDKAPAMAALTHFARALGAARSGDGEAARAALDRLADLRDQANETSRYWGKQVEIQRQAAAAWLSYEEDRHDEALDLMQAAATMEAGTEKHPITPGEVLPAHELLGDLLLELGRYDEAQAAYETALARSPNRLNSLYGAARAAELRGDAQTAHHYYSLLAEVAADADTELPRLAAAHAFLGSH